MRLLIVTQTIDKKDPVLGFFHEWVRSFAGEVESIKLIGLEVGEYDLPNNVEVFSLGKERGKKSLLRYGLRLNRLAWQLRKDYDVVFAHMNPEYVLAGGCLWKSLRKPITMWYAHGSVSWRLRLATWFSERVFTSTDSGYRFNNQKRLIVGQGIDTEKFSPAPSQISYQDPVKLITVGRITKAKQLETLITAVRQLKNEGFDCELKIVGLANTEPEKLYEQSLRDKVNELNLKNEVIFTGPVPQVDLPARLREATIFISDGATGSLDKVLLESMATGLMVISSNESFAKITPELGCIFSNKDQLSLVKSIKDYLALSDEEQKIIREKLRTEVVEHHSLVTFVGKIISGIKEIYGKN